MPIPAESHKTSEPKNFEVREDPRFHQIQGEVWQEMREEPSQWNTYFKTVRDRFEQQYPQDAADYKQEEAKVYERPEDDPLIQDVERKLQSDPEFSREQVFAAFALRYPEKANGYAAKVDSAREGLRLADEIRKQEQEAGIAIPREYDGHYSFGFVGEQYLKRVDLLHKLEDDARKLEMSTAVDEDGWKQKAVEKKRKQIAILEKSAAYFKGASEQVEGPPREIAELRKETKPEEPNEEKAEEKKVETEAREPEMVEDVKTQKQLDFNRRLADRILTSVKTSERAGIPREEGKLLPNESQLLSYLKEGTFHADGVTLGVLRNPESGMVSLIFSDQDTTERWEIGTEGDVKYISGIESSDTRDRHTMDNFKDFIEKKFIKPRKVDKIAK